MGYLYMAIKKFFIKSANDVISKELEKLQNRVNFLESNYTVACNVRKKPSKKKTAVYTIVDTAFEDGDEIFK